ncbi:MAG TPA: tubulin-like doman-containing protein [Armatimonadota bacterium]|nr:tubulin-like doman-containing protein [Armatimonadota bacterium]
MIELLPLELGWSEQQRYVTGGEFSPTLVLGLGGSGIGVVKRHKRLMPLRYGSDLELIRYLGIDAGSHDFGVQPGLPALKRSEICDIGIREAEARRILKQIKEGHHRELAEWLYPDLLVRVLTGAGAGTVRACGRFCLFARFARVNSALDAALQDLLELPERLRTLERVAAEQITLSSTPVIYLVSSCCGGSGAGLLLDIALLLRHKLQAIAPQIKAVLVMPSVFDKDATKPGHKQRLQANAVATLMELQYFLDEEEVRKARWRFSYPDATVRTLPLNVPLLDQCFLVEAKNSDGESLESKEDVFELIARSLVQEVTPVGAQVRAREVDLDAAGLVQACNETGRPRLFHSFAYTSIILPARELLTYSAVRGSRELLNGLTRQGRHDVSREVRTFLSEVGMNEFGASNQVQEMLLTRVDRGAVARLNGQGYLLANQDARKAPDRLLALQAARWSGVPGATRDEDRGVVAFVEGEVQRVARLNRQIMEGMFPVTTEAPAPEITDKKRQIRDKLQQILLTEGLEGLLGWLDQLEADLAAMASEMEEEAAGWSVAQWQTRLDTLRAQVNRIHWGDQPEQNLVRHHNAGVDQKILEPVRQEAGKLFLSLKKWLDEEVEPAALAARANVEAADKLLVGAQSRLEMQYGAPSGPVTGYTLERPAIGLPEFEAYYAQQRLDPNPLLLEWAKALEDPLASLSTTDGATLFQGLLKFCSGHFGKALSSTNVVEVLGDVLQANDQDQAIKTKLDVLFTYCKPFWQMEPRANQEFQESLLVGVPVPNGENDLSGAGEALLARVEGWLDEKLETGATRPQTIRTGYPFSLEVSRRVYGARPYYHRDWATWKENYELLRSEPRMPLHIHREMEARLPDMEPVLPGHRSFALAVALGCVVKKGKRFYGGVLTRVTGGRSTRCPKYDSDLETVWPGTRTKGVELLDSEDLLGSTRPEAMAVFLTSPDAVDTVNAAIEALQETRGKAYKGALHKHLSHLDGLIGAASKDDGLVRQLRLERKCVEQELEELESA